MFETDDFKTRLTTIVADAATRRGLTHYQEAAIDFLQNLARDNEAILTEQELRKAAPERRGLFDALQSAQLLASVAASYAVSENRKTLTSDDMEKAYIANFCQVWPFCK